MKALIISDVHSNIHALEAIYEQEKDSDIIYCAGDLVDMGPYPKEVIEWVKAHDVTCVKGNHDEAVVKVFRQKEHEQDLAQVLWKHHNARLLDEADIEFLENIPMHVNFAYDGFNYIMQHMYDGYEPIKSLEALRAYWEERTEGPLQHVAHKRCIFGHTHRQTVYYFSDHEFCLNPGSVSYDKGFDFLAGSLPSTQVRYMTITNGQVAMKTLAYDRRPLYEAIEQAEVCQAAKDRLTYLCLSDMKTFDVVPQPIS